MDRDRLFLEGAAKIFDNWFGTAYNGTVRYSLVSYSYRTVRYGKIAVRYGTSAKNSEK